MKTSRFEPVLGASILSLIMACSGDDANVITAGSGGDGGSGGGMNEGGSGGSDMGGPVEVSGSINSDTTWRADTEYVLTDLTYVEGGATLTIEAGTTVKGRLGSALVVTKTGGIEANGSAAAPIVFTSANDVGTRATGDWGGVVLLGAAPINIPVDSAQVEGIDPTEDRAAYGGDDAAHDCGTLNYVRIEFAGFELSADNELNGLTVGGCGSETDLDYVQVHRGQDDGIEFFGGTANLRHVVVSNAADDSIDWDQGWQGDAQFLAIVHDPADSDAGFESDNNGDANDAMPRSMPTIYNLTMVGSAGSGSPGMVLRRGTWGTIANAIVTGFPSAAVDIRDAASAAGAQEDPPMLVVENSIFFNNGADGMTHFRTEASGTDDDNDGGFDEQAFLADAARGNRMNEDPMLASVDASAPNLVPAAGSPAASGGATPPDNGFFDTSATFVGAFQPGAASWADGWSAFPAN